MAVGWVEGAVVAGAYLVGTFPTAALVAGREGHDVTAEGSRNPGATNVYRVAGARAGAVVFFGDLLKGAVTTAVGSVVGRRGGTYVAGVELGLAAGAAAVIGHCFPVFRRFRGGKGVATAGGVIFVLEPLVALGAALLWFLVARVGGKASLASLLIAIAVPVAVVALGRTGWEAAGVAALAVLIVARHADNISRLVRGEERSLRETGDAA